MASEEAIDAKLEAFENRMEEKMRSFFTEFNIGRPSSPRKSQHGETSDRRDDPHEHGHITSDLINPCMKVDFPRWEEGDPIGWISRAERYFQFYRTTDATRVEIAAIHHEGDAIQWFNWFEYTHGGLFWQRFTEGLLNRFGPIDFNNIDGQLTNIRQTSTIQEYQTRYFYRGPKVGDLMRSKGATTVHSYDDDYLRVYPGRTIEPRGMKDKGHSPTIHVEAYYPLYWHLSPRTKKVDKR
ncbi:hypothetical protein BHM03_00046461 [Ensete ventricosum]|nr:hypothetical protein BHM03_00046461 [Ensete ventricosum]